STPDQKLGAVAFTEETINWPPQYIVSPTELMIPAVPCADRLARDIVQHPALTRFHAGLVDTIAEHVIVITHDNATQRVAILHDCVAHRALVTFNVEFDASRIRLVDDGIISLVAVMSHGQEGPA